MQNEPGNPGPEFSIGRRDAENATPWLTIVIGAVAILLVVAVVVFLNRPHGGRAPTQPDAYAAKLHTSDVRMSVAENFAGASVTYIEGQVENSGDKTVVGALLRVTFRNSLGQIAQRNDSQPLMVVTSREPYIDAARVSETLPLRPGEKRDFRLAFEHVSADWDQSLPTIEVVSVATR
jgi:hypothetical protein